MTPEIKATMNTEPKEHNPEPPKQFIPCGGCGAETPDKRCIGCWHDFERIIPVTPPANLAAPTCAVCNCGLRPEFARPVKIKGELRAVCPNCICQSCDGEGLIHSHNPKCWSCNGSGLNPSPTPADQSAKPEAEDDDFPNIRRPGEVKRESELETLRARVAELEKTDIQRGSVMGRIAIALFGENNNVTDEECVTELQNQLAALNEVRDYFWPNQTGLPNKHRNVLLAIQAREELLRKA